MRESFEFRVVMAPVDDTPRPVHLSQRRRRVDDAIIALRKVLLEHADRGMVAIEWGPVSITELQPSRVNADAGS